MISYGSEFDSEAMQNWGQDRLLFLRRNSKHNTYIYPKFANTVYASDENGELFKFREWVYLHLRLSNIYESQNKTVKARVYSQLNKF